MDTINEVKKLKLPIGEYLVVGGGCLAVRGLRETHDLDITVLPGLFERLKKMGWPLDKTYEQKWGRQRLKHGFIEIYPDMFLEKTHSFVDVARLIRDADIIDGIPFLSLRHLRTFKLDSGREKDIHDIHLIDAYLKEK